MYCTKCGAQNFETAQTCVHCGQALMSVSATPAQIPNYLVHSILVTLLCCVPLGIVAIVFAAQVNSKVAAGDLVGAQAASDKAKLFCWLSFGIGLAGAVLYLFMTVLGNVH